jgi:hypothetical protein
MDQRHSPEPTQDEIEERIHFSNVVATFEQYESYTVSFPLTRHPPKPDQDICVSSLQIIADDETSSTYLGEIENYLNKSVLELDIRRSSMMLMRGYKRTRSF